MPTAFWDAVFKPYFRIVHDTGQQLTIDRTNFLTDGFLQIIQRTGFVSVNTRFQISPKEKITSWKIGRASEPREMRCPGNMFRTFVIDSFAVCAVAPSCWNQTLAQFILVRRSSGRKMFVIISMWRAELTGTVTLFSSKKWGPMTPKGVTAHRTVTGSLCSGRWWMLCGSSGDQ